MLGEGEMTKIVASVKGRSAELLEKAMDKGETLRFEKQKDGSIAILVE